LEHLTQHRLEVFRLLPIFVGSVWEFDAVVGVLPDAQCKLGLPVDAPALRFGKDGVEEVPGVEEGYVG
jgi:hypothetical protein